MSGQPRLPSDDGRCFAVGKPGCLKKRRTPATFEVELLTGSIALMTSGRVTQINEKPERFFRTFESGLVRFDRVWEFMEFYNDRRTRFSLDITNGRAQSMALHGKKVPEAIRKNSPAWKEVGSND